MKELENMEVTFSEFAGGLADVVARVPNGWRGLHVPFLPKLIVERIHNDAVLPKYAKDGDSGMDVYSTVNVLLRPQEKALIALGLRFQLPKHPLHALGYRWGMTLRPRSGLTAKTDTEAFLGTIDNTYRDEVKVIVKNDAQQVYDVRLERDDHEVIGIEYDVMEGVVAHDLEGYGITKAELVKLGVLDVPWSKIPSGTLLIRKGDRIAQLVFEQVIRPMEIVEGKVSTEEDRGGGFGSTGVRDDG